MLNFKERVRGVFKNFKGDLFGGITSGVIALPLALAFGVASGVGAIAGLYGAILVGLFAAIFGGTPTQISGPTGPITVVVAAIVASNPGNYQLIFLTIFLAGLFQIILGISKVGQLIRYVPYPVISGFMSGIGVIIILLQLNPLLGLDSQGTTINALLSLGESFQNIHRDSLLIGLATLAIVFFTPAKIQQKFPPSLIALVTVTYASVLLNLDVKTIGEIPTGLPDIQLSLIPFNELIKIVPVAITLAILGSVDSLLTSLVSDSLTRQRHNSNKELVGQGIGNMLSGMFGGLAGAGATMRTVINIKSGGRTRLSGVFHSLLLICIVLGAAPLVENVPMAVLAGILVKVGFDIIDYKFINIIYAAPRYDLAVMVLVFMITVFDDLIFAVGAGIVLSSVLFAATISRQTNVCVENIDEQDNPKEEYMLERESRHKIRIVNINGVFFFGSASRILTRVDDLLGTKYLIINCKNIPEMDLSAVFALEDMILRMKDKGINVFLVVRDKNVSIKLLRLGLMKIIKRDNVFYCKEKALNNAKELMNKDLMLEASEDENVQVEVEETASNV